MPPPPHPPLTPAAMCNPMCPCRMQLTPLERLKAHLALAQAAVVLYQLDRQLDAAKLDKHPLQKELVGDWSTMHV